MGSSEPSLVPEWLRSNGSANSGGRTGHRTGSSISHTYAASVVKNHRNNSFRSICELDSPRTRLDRSFSNNLRRNYANSFASPKHSYSSFSRSSQDCNGDKKKSRSAVVETGDHDSFDLRGKEALGRSHSASSKQQEYFLPRTAASDFTNIDRTNHTLIKAVHDEYLVNTRIRKAEFEREIPVIPVNEVQRVTEIGRVVQGLPIGSSALVGEGWSALAEVPAPVGTDNARSSHGHQTIETCSTPGVSSSGTGLTMAEVTAQSPGTTCDASQAFVEAEKFEQIAIKQCKRLIPVIPAMPKLTASSSADKLKSKKAPRNGDLCYSSKTGPHSRTSGSAHLASQSSRGAQMIREPMKASQVGKLYVLRPPWESSAPVHRDGSDLANDVGNKGLATLASPASSAAPSNNSKSSRAAFMEAKAAASNQYSPSAVDRKRMFSHARSRNEFFDSVRKKTSLSTSLSPEASSATSLPVEHSIEVVKETTTTTLSSNGYENGHSICIGGAREVDQKFTTGEDDSVSVTVVIPVEEEAEFLRSLGWEEDGSEDDGLTEEEINSFYQEVLKQKPTMKLLNHAAA